MSSNLVPLHVDKNTGKIVARRFSGTTAYARGYFAEFLVAQDTWVIEHNEDTTRLIYQIYDEDYNMIIPNNVEIVDENTLVITWNSPQRGFVHIAFFKESP